jgi:hypothetical protein
MGPSSYNRIRDEFACQVHFGMNTKIPNSEVIRSLWRRVKKDTKVRDLKPVKDVKGGSGLTGESKPITGGTGTADTTSTWCYVPKKNQILSDAQRTSSFPLQLRPRKRT